MFRFEQNLDGHRHWQRVEQLDGGARFDHYADGTVDGCWYLYSVGGASANVEPTLGPVPPAPDRRRRLPAAGCGGRRQQGISDITIRATDSDGAATLCGRALRPTASQPPPTEFKWGPATRSPFPSSRLPRMATYERSYAEGPVWFEQSEKSGSAGKAGEAAFQCQVQAAYLGTGRSPFSLDVIAFGLGRFDALVRAVARRRRRQQTLPPQDACCTLLDVAFEDLCLKCRSYATGFEMHVELNPTLEVRLVLAAERASLSVAQLVERVLSDFLNESAADPQQWVETTRKQLPHVWPEEDFAHWGPPRAD